MIARRCNNGDFRDSRVVFLDNCDREGELRDKILRDSFDVRHGKSRKTSTRTIAGI